MFVRIINRKENVHMTYDCKRVSYHYLKDKKTGKFEKIIICIDVGEQNERNIEIPFVDGRSGYDLIQMNDQGKTIDRMAC